MIHITLVSVPEPRKSEIHRLTLPLGATVRDALRAVGWPATEEALVGIFGEAVTLDWLLKDGDQVKAIGLFCSIPKPSAEPGPRAKRPVRPRGFLGCPARRRLELAPHFAHLRRPSG